MDIVLNNMDRPELLSMGADITNQEFLAEYQQLRKSWLRRGSKGSLELGVLHLLATKYPQPEPVSVAVSEESEPVKRGPGRPRKELQPT